METCSADLTFESDDEILWCDHSNKTSPPILLNGIICFPIFHKKNFFFLILIIGTLGSKRVKQQSETNVTSVDLTS